MNLRFSGKRVVKGYHRASFVKTLTMEQNYSYQLKIDRPVYQHNTIHETYNKEKSPELSKS